MTKKVLGIGAPCVDLTYYVDDSFLKSANILKGDAEHLASHEFEDLRRYCNSHFVPIVGVGGSSSNTIKGLANLGHSTSFLGKIGNDPQGELYLNNINQCNVQSHLIISPLPTSQVAVFVTEDHERSFLSFSGAGQHLKSDEISSKIFTGVSHVHIEGYMLDSFETAEKVMQLASASGATISLDAGCARIARTYKNDYLKLLQEYVTIAFANERELEELFNLPSKEGALALSRYCQIGVVQTGRNGCLVAAKGREFSSPAIAVDPIDTTGAWDLFACGFIHGYLAGYDLKDCAWVGNLIGGTAVTVIGAEIPDELWPDLISQIKTRFHT